MLTGLGLNTTPSNVGFAKGHQVKDVIDTCAYTGKKLIRKARTFEHIQPKSLGGSWNISNGLMTEGPANHARGNMDLGKWFKIHPEMAKNVQKYLDKYRGMIIKGHDYVKEVKNTLNKQAHGVVTFTGNKIMGNKLNIKA